MYIARNKNNDLYLYIRKPKKRKSIGKWEAYGYIDLKASLFPEVKWEDKEPTKVEVEITITKKGK